MPYTHVPFEISGSESKLKRRFGYWAYVFLVSFTIAYFGAQLVYWVMHM